MPIPGPIAWTEAARARVHPRLPGPRDERWPDPERAERLLARLRERAPADREWKRWARTADPVLRGPLEEVRRSLDAATALSPETDGLRVTLLGGHAEAIGEPAAGTLVAFLAAAGGPGHAVAALARSWDFELRPGARGAAVPARRESWGHDPDALGLWHAVRRLGLTLQGDDLAAFRAAAAAEREAAARLGPAALLLRCALSYALPRETAWARADGRELLAVLESWQAQAVLHGAALHGWCVLASADEPELMRQLAGHVGGYAGCRADAYAPTMLDAAGEAALPALITLFDELGRAAAKRQVAETICLVETPAAAAFFAARIGHPQAGALAAGWLGAHPALAIPALARVTSGRRPPPAAAVLLARLAVSHGVPEGVRLPAAARAAVARSEAVATPVRPAHAAALPDVWRQLEGAQRVPAWASPSSLPPLLLGSTGDAVPAPEVIRLLGWLARHGSEPPEAEIRALRDALTPGSRLSFGDALVHAWLAAGAPMREAWVVSALAVLAPERAADPIGRLVETWAREGRGRRAVLAIDALLATGADEAVFALHRLAAKAPAPSVQDRAREAIDEIAAARGLGPDELAEATLPDLGLDAGARLRLDYGARSFVAGFDARGKASVRDERGRPLARLPPPGKADDAALAQQAQERWRRVRADGEFVLTRQSARLEQAMCRRRRWTIDAFSRLVRHPLVAWLAKRLVWRVADGATFRVAEDWTLADVDDREWPWPADGAVLLPHPLELPPGAIAAWDALLADYEIVPPFPQMQRPVFRPTDREARAHEITRVEGGATTQAKLFGLRHRGWEGMVDPDGTVLAKHLDGGVAFLEVDGGRLGRVRLASAGGGRLTIGALDPIVFSELVRDLEWARLDAG